MFGRSTLSFMFTNLPGSFLLGSASQYVYEFALAIQPHMHIQAHIFQYFNYMPYIPCTNPTNQLQLLMKWNA